MSLMIELLLTDNIVININDINVVEEVKTEGPSW